jgi:hypothetical protein
MGISWEFVAFTLRTVGSQDQQNINYQIAGQLLFLLAPLCMFNLSMDLALRLLTPRRD